MREGFVTPDDFDDGERGCRLRSGYVSIACLSCAALLAVDSAMDDDPKCMIDGLAI